MNDKNLTKRRNYGLDFCRICAMLGIIILHIVNQGGILSATAGSLDYWVALFIYIFAMSSVNIFGMLSGYLGIKKCQYSTYRLIDLLVTVFTYSVIISVTF